MNAPYDEITKSIIDFDGQKVMLLVRNGKMWQEVIKPNGRRNSVICLSDSEAKKLRDFLNFALPAEPTLTTCFPGAVMPLVPFPAVPTDTITYKDL